MAASFRFHIFNKFQVFFTVSFYCLFMSDVKYNSYAARQMGEKSFDFPNVPNIKGLLIK